MKYSFNPFNLFSKFNFLKITEDSISKQEKSLFQNLPQFWDVLGELQIDFIRKNSAEVGAKFEVLEKNPKLIKKHYFYAILIGIFLTLILGFFIYYSSKSNSDKSIFDFIYLIFVVIAPYGIVKTYYSKLIRDLIKLDIAKENNWLYDAKENKNRFNDLKNYFPEFFNKGNDNQYVDDQFWGYIEKKNSLSNSTNKFQFFHSGILHYDMVTYDSKGREHRVSFDNHFFMFPLEKQIKSRFHLYPEHIGSKIGNFFSKKEINTESIEFNKIFAFSYNGKKDDSHLDIVQTLSPAVQIKLVELAKLKKKVEVLFVGNCVMFLFEGLLMPKLFTDFKNSLKVDSRDKEYLTSQLDNLTEISYEIGKYLD